MRARFRSWWQKIKQHSFITIGIIVALLVLIAFIFSAYRFGWSGSGFLNKTLWDWLQLLIIPLALAVIALLFQLANTRTERQIAKERYQQDQQIAKQRYQQDQQIAMQRYEQDQQIAKQHYEQDQQIALDKQREDLLQAYIDRISELLLKEQLRSSAADSEVRKIARVRTITILFQLDARRRIGYVFTFLRETGLMSNKPNEESIVSLSEANLVNINLGGAVLNDTDLRGAFLLDANLIHANLYQANLSKANLRGADLRGAWLMKANLSKANLSKVNLSGANMSHADLSGANVTEEQLKQAKSLKGATMPDGSIHP